MNIRLILILVFSVVLSGIAKAQFAGGGSIVDHLNSTGRVCLIQDERLSALLGNDPKVYVATPENQEPTGKIRMKGFRIRVYSGNNQNSSKNRAYGIQSEIKNHMPELGTYVFFKTPNWRLHVGDFRTSEEASSMLRILRQEFPGYSKDMFIVNDNIVL